MAHLVDSFTKRDPCSAKHERRDSVQFRIARPSSVRGKRMAVYDWGTAARQFPDSCAEAQP